MNGFVRSAPDFTDQPRVIDGASDLWEELLGASGRHARTATGVSQLPFGASVQLEMILKVRADEDVPDPHRRPIERDRGTDDPGETASDEGKPEG